MWRAIPVVVVLERLRQEDRHEFKTTLDYRGDSILNHRDDQNKHTNKGGLCVSLLHPENKEVVSFQVFPYSVADSTERQLKQKA